MVAIVYADFWIKHLFINVSEIFILKEIDCNFPELPYRAAIKLDVLKCQKY